MAGANNNEKCRWCNGRPHPAEFPWKFKCFIKHKGNGVHLVDSLNIGGHFYLHLENKDILTVQQISAIRAKGDEYAQKEELVRQLRTCDDASYDLFIEVLDICNMTQIAETMRNHFDEKSLCTASASSTPDHNKVKHAVVASSPGHQMEGGKEFADAFKDIKAYLSSMIDASIPFLLKCQDYDVIEGVDYEEIRAQPTPTGKANRLLEILERRNRKWLPAFLKALAETGQEHVAQKIQENLAK